MWTKNGAAVKSTIKLLIVVVNNFIVNRERQPQRSFSVNYKNKALLKNIINLYVLRQIDSKMIKHYYQYVLTMDFFISINNLIVKII